MTPLKLGVVSTFVPREDGIATFTRDLLEAVCASHNNIEARIAAITDPGSYYAYPPQVLIEIDQSDPLGYAEAGRFFAREGVDAISIQHEFGLYGIWGDPLQDFTPALLETVEQPIVTHLHTVLPNPRADIREAVAMLCDRSAATVVMVNVGAKILIEDYGVDPEKLRTIPHGVPPVQPADREQVKRTLRLDGRTVICTFGLLSRGKAIENTISALPDVIASHPDVIYLIMGETHPQVRKNEGESYRQELTALAQSLGIGRQVRFINQYLTQDTLVRYLQATDIYVTPYRDRNQITSGTLSYALGCGRAIVSTPYVYAAEALAEGRGLLAEFDNPESLARCINLYLDDPTFRQNTEERAYAYGQEMAWPRVGERYAELLHEVVGG